MVPIPTLSYNTLKPAPVLTRRSNSSIYLLSVLTVLQMNFEISDCCIGTRRVQLPRTVVTPYPW